MPYIPSALSVKTSITSCFCSSFHLRILLFVFTIHLIYLSMSSFCPLSSCKEIEQKVNGLRIGLMSALGWLVTHMHRFGSCDVIRSSKSIKSSLQGDERPDIFKHLSRALIIK